MQAHVSHVALLLLDGTLRLSGCRAVLRRDSQTARQPERCGSVDSTLPRRCSPHTEDFGPPVGRGSHSKQRTRKRGNAKRPGRQRAGGLGGPSVQRFPTCLAVPLPHGLGHVHCTTCLTARWRRSSDPFVFVLVQSQSQSQHPDIVVTGLHEVTSSSIRSLCWSRYGPVMGDSSQLIDARECEPVTSPAVRRS